MMVDVAFFLETRKILISFQKYDWPIAEPIHFIIPCGVGCIIEILTSITPVFSSNEMDRLHWFLSFRQFKHIPVAPCFN